MCPVKIYLNESKRLNEVLSNAQLVKTIGSELAFNSDGVGIEEEEEEEKDDGELVVEEVDKSSSKLQCLTCKVEFVDRKEQVSHYKSDFHRYNIKLRLLEQTALTLEQFSDMKDTDALSISGSNSELSDDGGGGRQRRHSISLYLGGSSDDEEPPPDLQFNNRLPKFYLKNDKDEIIAFYKKLVYGKKSFFDASNFLQTSLDALRSQQLWTVILFNGNHFAAAVFEGDKVVAHRTFHHYVVRAKRGTAQSANDAKGGGQAKSAGANLRRYNEASQSRLIHELLTEWKDEYLNKCQLIFMRIPSYKRAVFYGGKTPIFCPKDNRLRPIPFTTRRPTFNEVIRTHKELYSVTVYDSEEAAKMLARNSNNDARRLAEKQRKKDALQKQQEQQKQKNERKKKEKKKQKAYTTPSLTQLALVDADDTSDGDVEIEMTEVEESIPTAHLSEFGIDPELSKKNKKKKTRNTRKPQPKDEVLPLVRSPSQERRKVEEKMKFYEKFPRHESQLIIDLYTSCVEGQTQQVAHLLANKTSTGDVTPAVDGDVTVDEERMATLLSSGIDNQGNTLLHVVAKCGNSQLISLLLEHGSDPAMRNLESYLPYNLCPHKKGKNVFRKFRASNPDKFDYQKAEIPSPLTEEAEKEIANRQAEKKKEKKGKRKLKEKKKKEEEQVEQAEEAEKSRFVQMSDREKRLLAIEKRMKATEAPQVSASVSHNRCWKCGESLFAKVPFTYYDFNFCSTKCLRIHRTSTNN